MLTEFKPAVDKTGALLWFADLDVPGRWHLATDRSGFAGLRTALCGPAVRVADFGMAFPSVVKEMGHLVYDGRCTACLKSDFIRAMQEPVEIRPTEVVEVLYDPNRVVS